MNNRKNLRLEILEERLTMSVTIDAPSNHVVSLEDGWTGVLLNRNSVGGQVAGSVLLPTGKHVLTANHVSMSSGGVASRAIEIDLPGGSSPDYTLNTVGRSVLNGVDVAILELPVELPPQIERYDIYRESDEIGKHATRIGFGRTGQGEAKLNSEGQKQIGFNRYDVSVPQYTALGYDFDDGTTAHNAWGDLGMGTKESIAATHDSGSPTFIEGKIAGITKSGVTTLDTPAFGQQAIDIRVSSIAQWIDSVIDEPGAPTVENVSLRGTSWAAAVDYAFDELVAEGKQLRPIPTAGVNSIAIRFSEHVLLDGSELELAYTERRAKGSAANHTLLPEDFDYDVTTHIATWTFDTPLVDGKYAIHLSDSITDVGLNRLDGDWNNGALAHGGTPDNFADDPRRAFNVGNGVAGSADHQFRLHFSLLAFDYTGDGVVDSADAKEWGQQFVHGRGETVADANGDNLVNYQDYPTTAVLGQELPLLAGGGDFHDDERVDGTDASLLFLHAQELPNGTNFSSLLNDQSAWYLEGSVDAPPATLGAPKVHDVIIGSTTSAHDDYSFNKSNAVGSGAQLATVPVGEADTVTIVFSEQVNVSAGSLAVIGRTKGVSPQLAAFSYNTLTHSATWRFQNWKANDSYVLSLSDSITDIAGNPLDGEWTNPQSVSDTSGSGQASTFSQGNGNGLAGGDFNFVITLMAGDYDRDGRIGQDDLSTVLLNWGKALYAFADGNSDGRSIVGQDDLDQLLLT